ncbi:hypothetical protein GGF46_000521 [Coemansia sp. RSA 552]|nr:hypothetical protein GGF46_000521 [Coemansia sp. RSA 552]
MDWLGQLRAVLWKDTAPTVPTDSSEARAERGVEMASRRVPVMSWVQPTWDCRFVVGSDVGLRLYHMSAAQENDAGTKFEMVDFRSMPHAVTCLAPYPRTLEQSSVVAAGNLAGEVGLQLYPVQGSEGLGVEYSSSSINIYEASDRVCRDIAFSPVNSDLLACGFDHKESHPSLYIHDISRNRDIKQLLGTRSTPWSTHSESIDQLPDALNRSRRQNRSRAPSVASAGPAGDAARDGEYGPSYSGSGVTSLSWVPNSADDLLVASKKTRCSIRLYDLRAPRSGENVLYVPMPSRDGTGSPGTIYDLSFDPFNSVRYMAHDRSGIANMWDIRWAVKPIHTFSTGQQEMLHMEFSPRRSGVIASLGADSSDFAIFTVNEFIDGRASQTDRADARSFLGSTNPRERYSIDRSALISAAAAPPPQSHLHTWTERQTTVPLRAELSEPYTAFLWVPPIVSSRTMCREQLVSCGVSGALHTTALPFARISAVNCRGDMAISNNWSQLQGALPSTDLEMDMLHIAAPELHEVVLERSNRHSHAQAGSTGAKGSRISLTAASAGLSASASLSSVQQQLQQSNSASGLLARRHQAARQNSTDSDTRAVQLRERLRTMNLGLGHEQTMSDTGGKPTSPQLQEQMAGAIISYKPSLEEQRTNDSKIEAALRDDILVQMRQRAQQGYGPNADANVRIFRDDPKICDMWRWVRDSYIRRYNGGLYVGYGVDASFYGVYDIMRLRRRELKYLYRHSAMEARRRKSAAGLAGTRLEGQRQLALSYCGWGLEGRIREQHIRALENAREFSAAAGTSFIYGDHQRCLQSLEKSTAQDQKLLSFMLKAQLDDNSMLTPVELGKSALAPGDMFGCPHLQMIFMYLATGSWSKVIGNMEGLPLSYRLAVALRYLGDRELMSYMVAAGRTAARQGNLDGLVITGISGAGGRLVVQQYVDWTADVQTAALVSSFDPTDDAAAGGTGERWIYEYRHLLNKWRMFTTRCLFDIAQGNYRESKGLARLSAVGEKVAVQPADVRCSLCHQSLESESSRRKGRARPAAGSGVSTPGAAGTVAGAVSVTAGASGAGLGPAFPQAAQPLIGQKSALPGGDGRRRNAQEAQTRLLYTHCPRCNGSLPRCVVCRMKLGTPVLPQSTADAPTPSGGDFAQWFSWCQTCGHGGHVAHLQSWFSIHSECPVPACECHCDRRD